MFINHTLYRKLADTLFSLWELFPVVRQILIGTYIYVSQQLPTSLKMQILTYCRHYFNVVITQKFISMKIMRSQTKIPLSS